MRLAKAARTNPRALAATDRRGTARERPDREDRDRRPWLHQFLHDARRLAGRDEPRARPKARAMDAADARRRQERDRRVRLRQSDRSAARRPRPASGIRGDGREPARGGRLARPPRVLRERRRPPDGHPRGERVAALPRALRRKDRRFPANGYRGDYVRPVAERLRDAAGRGAAPARRP